MILIDSVFRVHTNQFGMRISFTRVESADVWPECHAVECDFSGANH